MSAISLCPKCQKPVSLPAGLDSPALVRCPLCGAEYPLGEALPPELIPVAAVSDQASTPLEIASDQVPLPPDGATDQAPATDVATAVAFGLGSAAEHEVAKADGATMDDGVVMAGQEEGELTMEHEENEAAAVTAGQPRLAAMATVRGRRPPASPLKRLIEVLTGGLAGCLVAYYGLAIWYGPEFTKFGFPQLPGYVWLTTASDKNAADPGKKPAAAKHVPAKPSSSNGR